MLTRSSLPITRTSLPITLEVLLIKKIVVNLIVCKIYGSVSLKKCGKIETAQQLSHFANYDVRVDFAAFNRFGAG